jgi:hypothetical protein
MGVTAKTQKRQEDLTSAVAKTPNVAKSIGRNAPWRYSSAKINFRIETMKLLIAGVVSVVLAFAMQSSRADSPTEETGILTGKVTIGPLRPGPVRVDQTEPAPTAMFASHKIVILAEDGKTKIKEVPIDAQGNYKVELKPGEYSVDFTPHDIGFKQSNPPKRVTVKAGKTTKQNLDLDTGIR